MLITIKGIVNKGNGVGKGLGFPTANISIDDLIKIDNGVYVAYARIDGYKYEGVANVGFHPTVGDNFERLLEVHIFGYNGSLYDKQIEVSLLRFIRPEHKFDYKDQLVDAIRADVEYAKNYFKNS